MVKIDNFTFRILYHNGGKKADSSPVTGTTFSFPKEAQELGDGKDTLSCSRMKPSSSKARERQVSHERAGSSRRLTAQDIMKTSPLVNTHFPSFETVLGGLFLYEQGSEPQLALQPGGCRSQSICILLLSEGKRPTLKRVPCSGGAGAARRPGWGWGGGSDGLLSAACSSGRSRPSGSLPSMSGDLHDSGEDSAS